MHVDNSILNFE